MSDTRPFAEILSCIEGEDLFILMKVLLAHVKNPNFLLRYGRFMGKTLLQGAVGTGDEALLKMLISNTHGCTLHVCEVIEPIVIDVKSAKWIEYNVLPMEKKTSTTVVDQIFNLYQVQILC